MEYGYVLDTPVGRIGVGITGDCLSDLFFIVEGEEFPAQVPQRETILVRQVAEELAEFFAGDRREFSVPLAFTRGTPFQQKVWEALLTIPYGETRSYKEIAMACDSPRAFRAVGMANNRNPISIIVPCHRVIGADGSLVGYGGGLGIKIQLLEMEKNTGE